MRKVGLVIYQASCTSIILFSLSTCYKKLPFLDLQNVPLQSLCPIHLIYQVQNNMNLKNRVFKGQKDFDLVKSIIKKNDTGFVTTKSTCANSQHINTHVIFDYSCSIQSVCLRRYYRIYNRQLIYLCIRASIIAWVVIHDCYTCIIQNIHGITRVAAIDV